MPMRVKERGCIKPNFCVNIGTLSKFMSVFHVGAEWSRQRKLYSYMFSHKMLKDHMFKEFESLTDDLIEKIDKFADSGGEWVFVASKGKVLYVPWMRCYFTL